MSNPLNFAHKVVLVTGVSRYRGGQMARDVMWRNLQRIAQIEKQATDVCARLIAARQIAVNRISTRMSRS